MDELLLILLIEDVVRHVDLIALSDRKLSEILQILDRDWHTVCLLSDLLSFVAGVLAELGADFLKVVRPVGSVHSVDSEATVSSNAVDIVKRSGCLVRR